MLAATYRCFYVTPNPARRGGITHETLEQLS